MARKSTKQVPAKRNLQRGTKNEIFSQFKLTESYTSLILGAIVVLVAGILIISFARGNRIMQTSSTKEEPKSEETKSSEKQKREQVSSKTSSTYTIRYTIMPGDDLWSISENIYSNGYKWVEIAKVNKLEDPGLIHAGNKLTIPTVLQKESATMESEVSPKPTDKIMENNSIAGNTYTIKPGDNLWDISVRAYGDGYRWVELAKVNNIQNPDLIYSGNILKLPR